MTLVLVDPHRARDSELIHADGSVAFTADQSLGSNALTDVADPTDAQDAATKAYVDAAFAAAGTGDVVGPGSATDNALPRFSGTTGKLLQGSGVTLSDNDKLALKSSYCPVGSGSLVSSTVTFDLDTSNYLVHTLTGNHTGALSNVSTGQAFQLDLVQDGTGSRTWTWWSGITWAGGVAPTITATASKRDCFGFRCTGSGAYLGFVLGQNY